MIQWQILWERITVQFRVVVVKVEAGMFFVELLRV